MKIITVEELKEKMDKGENVNLVDVREPHEFEEVNIGGRLVPLGKVQTMQIEELEDLKDKEVILYCRSGNRSAQAALVLEMLGFQKVKNLEGGMVEWKNLS